MSNDVDDLDQQLNALLSIEPSRPRFPPPRPPLAVANDDHHHMSQPEMTALIQDTVKAALAMFKIQLEETIKTAALDAANSVRRQLLQHQQPHVATVEEEAEEDEETD